MISVLCAINSKCKKTFKTMRDTEEDHFFGITYFIFIWLLKYRITSPKQRIFIAWITEQT